MLILENRHFSKGVFAESTLQVDIFLREGNARRNGPLFGASQFRDGHFIAHESVRNGCIIVLHTWSHHKAVSDVSTESRGPNSSGVCNSRATDQLRLGISVIAQSLASFHGNDFFLARLNHLVDQTLNEVLVLLHVIIERDKNVFGIFGAYSSQASRSCRIGDGPCFEKGTHIARCS